MIYIYKYICIDYSPLPLHWRGTPGMLQARGRETASVRLMGIWKGTLPVAMRQRQSLLLLIRDLRELQQSEVGAVPFWVLLVTKLRQGVKVVIIEGVHGVVIWAETEEKRMVREIARAEIKNLLKAIFEISSCVSWICWNELQEFVGEDEEDDWFEDVDGGIYRDGVWN